MHLREILTADRIRLHLAARDKSSVLSEVAKLLSSGTADATRPAPSVDAAAVERVLAAREAEGSTGVGSGVAIPHGRVAGLDHFVAALGIHDAGLPFDAIDGQPVHVVFALVGPDKATGEHLKCLARIGRLLRDDATRKRLREAQDPAAVLELVLAADGA